MPANELFVALALRTELLILFVVFCIFAKMRVLLYQQSLHFKD